MTSIQRFSLFLVRVSIGWFMLYAGISKIINPKWSAAGYINGAKNFTPFFHWLTQPNILPIVNLLNEWGLALLGVSLILGLFVRFSSYFGVILMLLYYAVIFQFPHPDANSYIVDQHIIFACVLIFLSQAKAGRVFGLDKVFSR